jgi:Cys-rich four helix bundle protein (predicted Tat secretion target)
VGAYRVDRLPRSLTYFAKIDEASQSDGGTDAAHGALVETAQYCVSTGAPCMAHCLQEFEAGRFELSSCASRVQLLTAACRALSQLAAIGSKYTTGFAKATADVCRTCEDECRQHADMHEIYKACADTCVSCIEECEKRGACANTPEGAKRTCPSCREP